MVEYDHELNGVFVPREPLEIPQVRDGLSAIELPDLRRRGFSGSTWPTTTRDALGRLNEFLAGLNNQGATIVGILPTEVVDITNGHSAAPTVKNIAIVSKPPSGK